MVGSVFRRFGKDMGSLGSMADCVPPPFPRIELFLRESPISNFKPAPFSGFLIKKSPSSASLSNTLPLAPLGRLDFSVSFSICKNDCWVLIICPARRNLHRGIRASATPHFRTLPQSTKRPTPPNHRRVLEISACGESANKKRFISEMERRCSSAGSRLVVVR